MNTAQCAHQLVLRQGWGGGGDETFPKFAETFAESFANILAKFHELKISKKTQQ